MRRIAAVFASKRSDRSDAASSTAHSATTDNSEHTTHTAKPSTSKRFFRSISRKSKPVDPAVNRLNSTDLPPSSSSSSSGAPTTPDDDRGSLLRAPANKAWLSLPHPVDSRLGSFHHWDPLAHDPTRPLPPRPTASPSTFDTEDDDESEESSVALDLSQPPARLVPLAPRDYLLKLTSSHLQPPYAPPPLLHVQGKPLFPRSTNRRGRLPYVDSLESAMHRRQLHRRLERGDLSPSETRSIASFGGRTHGPRERLSLHMDDCAVREGHVQSHSAGLRTWADRPCFEDRLLVLLADDVPASPNAQPPWSRIAPATGFGVAALEFSITLELLAGLYEDELPPDQDRQSQSLDASALGYLRLETTPLSLDLGPSLSQSPSTPGPSSPTHTPHTPSPPTMSPSTTSTTITAAPSPKPAQANALPAPQPRGQLYRASPSPLRMEATSASPPTPSTMVSPATSAVSNPTAVASSTQPPPKTSSPPTSASSAAPQPPLKSALKQGVRFAEEEKDDQIPLGYVMRIKRKKEEKVRFLQAERERRMHEEERRKHEEEKRRWEEERAKWEREKRAIEEERKKRMYAEEVVAARSRRESQRYGFGPLTGEGLATGQWDRSERPRPEREGSTSSYTRASYDPAHAHIPRQYSDSSLAPPAKPSRGSSGSGTPSPVDSRPNSVYGTGSANGSRPPSTHVLTPSSSQQDVRPRERKMSGGGSRRGSMISESGSWRRSEHYPVPPLPSVWTMGMNMNVPPMSMSAMPMTAMPMGMPMQMPMYGMPMDPLLPPSPPFMMQQYGPRSHGSSNGSHSPARSQSSSPTLGRHNLPASGSSERVNRMSQSRGSSASARAPSVPRSESSPHRSRHQRTSSGEIPTRPSNHRSQTDDRRSTKSSSPAVAQRPTPTHSSSLPPHPPPVFSQARSSWALPQSGFENLSRRPNNGRRQTIIS